MSLGLLVCLCLSHAACTNKTGFKASSPIVQKLSIQPNAVKPGILNSAPSVNVTVTVDKSTLFSQEFLYGADLQYSDYHDPGFDLMSQSMAIGHIPVHFRIAGNELQLVADNRRLFSSDVNHPELLISRFKILSQDDRSMTLSAANSSVFLAEVFEGTKNSGDDSLFNPVGPPPRESWVRSFDYVAEGNYLLQQSSIVTSNGNIVEFMESIFPRSTLEPGKNFEKFIMDPTDPVGIEDDFLGRYRFLPGETIVDATSGTTSSGDPKTVAYAEHFDISPRADGSPGTIDWYVTPNIPDETLPAIKQAVEGWNRYFRAEKGVERDVMQFKGKLPDGIHIGDPRYNVINWDSKRVAGAAYESQAVDPLTGRQSHSLIYMPAAWLQIGLDYFKTEIASDVLNSSAAANNPTSKKKSGARQVRIECMRDMKDSVALITSGKLNRDDIKKYSVELLKQTLFHEVGHALGLAHNFKGSLSYDVSDPNSSFSTSIMDYNDYEIERAAFKDVNSADGPLLEYDRQAISTIYNGHRDVSDKDPIVPSCNDAEADLEDGGVDPLCIRYDTENNPTHSVITALKRIGSESIPGDTTLAQALSRIPELVLKDEDIQAAQDEAAVKKLLTQLAAGLKGSMGFYYSSGKASLSKVVKTNIKSLLSFEDGVLPDGYDELQMRSTAFDGVQKTLAMMSLPDGVQAALSASEQAGLAKIAQAPYFNSSDSAPDARDQIIKALQPQMDKSLASFSRGEGSNLAQIRAGVLASLARHDKVPFYFGQVEGKNLDLEKDLIGLLLNAIDSKTSKTTRIEQLAAAKALATYRGRLNGDPALDAAIKIATDARLTATDASSRDHAQKLIDILSGPNSKS